MIWLNWIRNWSNWNIIYYSITNCTQYTSSLRFFSRVILFHNIHTTPHHAILCKAVFITSYIFTAYSVHFSKSLRATPYTTSQHITAHQITHHTTPQRLATLHTTLPHTIRHYASPRGISRHTTPHHFILSLYCPKEKERNERAVESVSALIEYSYIWRLNSVLFISFVNNLEQCNPMQFNSLHFNRIVWLIKQSTDVHGHVHQHIRQCSVFDT